MRKLWRSDACMRQSRLNFSYDEVFKVRAFKMAT